MIIEAVFQLLNPYCTASNPADVNAIDYERDKFRWMAQFSQLLTTHIQSVGIYYLQESNPEHTFT